VRVVAGCCGLTLPRASDTLALMRLVGQLSNPSSSLERVLEAPSTSAARPSSVPMPPSCRLGNGVVQRAVVKVLSTADRPMRLREICSALDKMLGQPVSVESVSWSLRTGSRGLKPQFERVSRGVYCLRT
jgi:hypothetical protein